MLSAVPWTEGGEVNYLLETLAVFALLLSAGIWREAESKSGQITFAIAFIAIAIQLAVHMTGGAK